MSFLREEVDLAGGVDDDTLHVNLDDASLAEEARFLADDHDRCMVNDEERRCRGCIVVFDASRRLTILGSADQNKHRHSTRHVDIKVSHSGAVGESPSVVLAVGPESHIDEAVPCGCLV